MTVRRAFRILAVAGAMTPLGLPAASALEQPAALSEEDLRLGIALTPDETTDAQEFCRETLGRTAAKPDDITRTCDCFPREWEARTNRLHRLVLPITMNPNAPASRRNLALIERQQGGVHDDRLRQLSTEYEIAARQSLKNCRALP